MYTQPKEREMNCDNVVFPEKDGPVTAKHSGLDCASASCWPSMDRSYDA